MTKKGVGMRRRLVRRQLLIDGLDRLRLRLLTRRYVFDRPRLKYHPLPFVGLDDSGRKGGSLSRFAAIAGCLDNASISGGSVVDYGCNVGYFSLAFACRGFFAFGVDENREALDLACTAARLSRIQLFCPINLRVTTDTLPLLPSADIALVLSIWHHWVRGEGLATATNLLRRIFDKTGRVLFFDTGECEMPAEYGLPFADTDPRTWLEAYLRDELQGEVQWLGRHAAFAPGGDEHTAKVERNLFAVKKKG